MVSVDVKHHVYLLTGRKATLNQPWFLSQPRSVSPSVSVVKCLMHAQDTFVGGDFGVTLHKLAAPRVENETEPHCSETVVNVMLIGISAERRNGETFETSNIHVRYTVVFLSHKIVFVGLDLVLER